MKEKKLLIMHNKSRKTRQGIRFFFFVSIWIFTDVKSRKIHADSSSKCGLMLNFLRSDVHQMVLELVQIFLIQQLQDNKTYQTAVVCFCFFWSFFFFSFLNLSLLLGSLNITLLIVNTSQALNHSNNKASMYNPTVTPFTSDYAAVNTFPGCRQSF